MTKPSAMNTKAMNQELVLKIYPKILLALRASCAKKKILFRLRKIRFKTTKARFLVDLPFSTNIMRVFFLTTKGHTAYSLEFFSVK